MSNALQQQSCNSDGLCMVCKTTPPGEETLLCNTCESSWHVTCLVSRPETLASTIQWTCPDCSGDALTAGDSSARTDGGLVAAILAIETDSSLTELQKAQRRQELLSGTKVEGDHGNGGLPKDKKGALDGLDDKLKCSICVDMLDRPVTTPCGHNFCLKCFEKSVLYARHSKRECPNCRANIREKWASNLRINMTLVNIVRMAKLPKLNITARPWKSEHFLHNQDRPDNAFTTERAKKSGNANAASGKIFVTIPTDHFGPITAEYDPLMNRGVLVGDTWKNRLECRQYGVHFPHISGIAGQASHGAQSVVLSGGYIDDEDHGEWFLYTGSGGRDLSGNKRTNKKQSFDQKFKILNESIRVSCLEGYPVRVVRSKKEKRSAYAPEEGLRYDGIYRVESCWQKVGTQGYKVCRYLFVRCDNEAAPWTSDAHGDRPRCLPSIPELNNATDKTERHGSPSWDFDEEDGCWKWKRPPPVSRKSDTETSGNRKRSRTRQAQTMTNKERLLKDFSCPICRQVMNLPVTTHCGHNFCKTCIEGAFSGISFVRDRSRGGRSLRSQKNVMKCPSCPTDISEFLQDPKVNRELMDVIESLKLKAEESEEDSIPVSSEEDKTENMKVGNKKRKVQ